jgi:calcineurin-like phosphoesterase family protein
MTIWFTSDTHFAHKNMVKVFKLPDGSPSRPFQTVAEMDETLIQRWNEVVKPADHIYHLGDVTMHRRIEEIRYRVLDRLVGHKRLILGNHDLDTVQNYLKWFKKIVAVRVHDNILFSHIPIHIESLGRFTANVHGHTHHRTLRTVTQPDGRKIPYINVCVEQTDYRPISLEEVKERIRRAS